MTQKRAPLLPLVFHKSPYPCFVYVLPLLCAVISPPPADLAVVDVLGGECAIGDSRKAFRDTSILGYLSLLLQSLLGSASDLCFEY